MASSKDKPKGAGDKGAKKAGGEKTAAKPKATSKAPAEKADPAPDFPDNIRLSDVAQKLVRVAGGVGAVALIVSLGLGFTGDKAGFMHSYLVAYTWILSIGIGALWWVCLQHLVNAKWSVVVRRVGELFASTMPILALLSLPIVIPTLMGDSTLYVWADAHQMHENHLLHHKAPYLNLGFFAIRLVIYFGFWVVLSRFYLNKSLSQDKGTTSAESFQKLQGISAPSMILIALTLTFCSVDFLMTLEPTWYSTIFGVYFFAGCVVSFHSFLALSLMWLQKQGRLVKSVTIEHYHDIGKMMFAFTVFWAYIGFSQFMLIWYANMPEETEWYHVRAEGDWLKVSAFLVIGNFAIPFFGLMSRQIKRNKTTLGFWAIWILVVHWVDMFWLVKPHLHTEHLPFSITDVTCTIAVLGLFIAGAAYPAQKCNLIPLKDPRLPKSLAFENF